MAWSNAVIDTYLLYFTMANFYFIQTIKITYNPDESYMSEVKRFKRRTSIQFDTSQYNFSVSENVANVHVGRIFATVPGSEQSAISPIAYSLVETEIGKEKVFNINNLTGDITCASLDRETRSIHFLRAFASSPDHHPATANVQVVVLDLNDNAPVVTYPANGSRFTFHRSDSAGILVFTIQASDLDVDENALLTYNLIYSYNTVELLSLNGTNVYTLKALHNYVGHILNMMIVVQDGGSPALSTTSSFVFAVAEDEDPKSQYIGYVLKVVFIPIFIVLLLAIVLFVCYLYIQKQHLIAGLILHDKDFGPRDDYLSTTELDLDAMQYHRSCNVHTITEVSEETIGSEIDFESANKK